MQSTITGSTNRCSRFLTSSRRTALYSTFTLENQCNTIFAPTRHLKIKRECHPNAHARPTTTRLLTSSPSPLPSTESSSGDDTTKIPLLPSTPFKSEDSPPENTMVDKGAIFPWVSSTTPLPRLCENDDLSGLSNSFRSRFAKRVSVALEMGVPIWNILVTKAWEKELAKNCEWAFKMAVCGLLSRTFQVNFNTLYTDKMLHLNTIDKTSSESSINDEHMTEDDNQALSEYVEGMIEESLLQLYPKLPSLPTAESPFRIHFQLKPIASRLENAFLVPSLTREDIKLIPKLKGSYSRIENEWKSSQSVKTLREMAEELHKNTDHGGSKRSLIVDVSVDCLEVFQVRDRETGDIVQGYGAGEEGSEVGDTIREETVTHLVRFEVETKKGENPGERKVGSWQIIDIDDMLDGNVWH